MREIALDTETTGLEVEEGHRIVEIGCVELINHTPTGEVWQSYFNPQRPMSADAQRITSLSDDFLRDKPLFADGATGFLDFIGDARLIIHNAPFDMKFLNFELEAVGRAPLSYERVTDTLELARLKFPGTRLSLDALCQRFGVDRTGREYHGALIDSHLLAEVYLELIGGRQPGLIFQTDSVSQTEHAEQDAPATGAHNILSETGDEPPPRKRRVRPVALPPRFDTLAHQQHLDFLAQFPTPAKWLDAKS